MKTTATITVQNKKYKYTLSATKDCDVVHFVCSAANIDQDFLAEDIPALLIDLPNLIVAELDFQRRDTEVVRFRVSAEDKKEIKIRAAKCGFKSVSEYVRSRALA
jgi:hypothetical protein